MFHQIGRRDRDRPRARDRPRHRRGRWRNRPCRASAADSGWSPKAGGTPRRPAARSARRRSSAASTCPSRCGRPARCGRRLRPKRGAVEQRRAAEGQPYAVEIKQRRSHVRLAESVLGQWMGDQHGAAAAERDAQSRPDFVGNRQRRAERHLDRVERPFGARHGQAGEFGEAEDAEQRTVWIVEFAPCRAAAESLPARRWSARPRCPASASRIASARCRNAWSARVPPNAPTSSSEVAPRSSASAIASSPSVLSFSGGKRCRARRRDRAGRSSGTESKSPTHSSGTTPSALGMPHAGVGGDDAAFRRPALATAACGQGRRREGW